MAREISSLNQQKLKLKEEHDRLCDNFKDLKMKQGIKKSFSSTINSDAKMRFYTGIQTVAVFNLLFSFLKPHVSNLVFWRGSKVTTSIASKKTTTKTHRLCCKDQFVLVLMRLRLGLLNQDLADRFEISASTCSHIFTTWIKFLSKFLGSALIVWLPKDVILSNLPNCFHGYYLNFQHAILKATKFIVKLSNSL